MDDVIHLIDDDDGHVIFGGIKIYGIQDVPEEASFGANDRIGARRLVTLTQFVKQLHSEALGGAGFKGTEIYTIVLDGIAHGELGFSQTRLAVDHAHANLMGNRAGEDVGKALQPALNILCFNKQMAVHKLYSFMWFNY